MVTAVRSTRVLVGDEVLPAVVVIKDGKIHQIHSDGDFSEDVACEVSWLSFRILPLVEYGHMEEWRNAGFNPPGFHMHFQFNKRIDLTPLSMFFALNQQCYPV